MTNVIKQEFMVTKTKSTQAEFFKDVEVGDIVEVEISLVQTFGRMPKAIVRNHTKGDSRVDVLSRIGAGIIKLGLEEN